MQLKASLYHLGNVINDYIQSYAREYWLCNMSFALRVTIDCISNILLIFTEQHCFALKATLHYH